MRLNKYAIVQDQIEQIFYLHISMRKINHNSQLHRRTGIKENKYVTIGYVTCQWKNFEIIYGIT